MSRERFQSETGQTIDDNSCSFFFGNTSPLFYTVNPRSGISLRQQEQLGAPSILKSFRDLPGCTRLSTSLTNLDSANKRAQFPLLPDISQKGNMGKSLHGHHSSNKRFVRERYNPPFKVNAKIRHVYTQEVTTIEHGPDQDHNHGHHHHHHQQQQPNQPTNNHSSSSHRHSSLNLHRSTRSYHDVATCHRQTQTEPQLFPGGESKQKPEVEEQHAQYKPDGSNLDGDKVDQNQTMEEGVAREVILEQKKALSRKNSKSQQMNNGGSDETDKLTSNRVDVSTSPIPSPYFTDASATSTDSAANPFSGCSQMTVYPPLNYVRKLEDLEKITGHIVIQRFFTKTDDAFGTWLEKQLGMTSKSVSVGTSEIENAKTTELQDVTLTEDTGVETGSRCSGDTVNETESRAIGDTCNETESMAIAETGNETGSNGIGDTGNASSEIGDTGNETASSGVEDTVKDAAGSGIGDAEKETASSGVGDTVNDAESNGVGDTVKDAESNGVGDTVKDAESNGVGDTGNEAASNGIGENGTEAASSGVGDTEKETASNGIGDTGNKNGDTVTDNGASVEPDAVVTEASQEKDDTKGEDEQKERSRIEKIEQFVAQEGFITGAISNPGEGGLQETENRRPPEVNPPVDCAIADLVKCECYLEEICKNAGGDEQMEQVEPQIVPENADIANATAEIMVADEVDTLISTTEVVPASEVPVVEEEENNKVATEKEKSKSEEDIDEVVRCTLEAYLMAPMTFEDINENDEVEKQNKKNELESLASPTSATTTKSSEVDSGRADSIQSQENNRSFDGTFDTEGNTTSHDSVETVYEIPLAPPKHIDLDNGPHRILQRCLSADSCIGTESSGDAKNPVTNASQSSNDTIEVLDPIISPKELADLNLGSPASAPPIHIRSHSTKLPVIASVKSSAMKLTKNYRTISSARSQRSLSPGSAGAGGAGVITNVRGPSNRRTVKTDVEAEDADGESETESEITDNHFLPSAKPSKHHQHHPDGTDLELEEVDEDEGDDDDKDAFDKMVANHLKYSRGLPTATSRRSRLNRGTQTTKSIEPSTTSGSISPCSASSNSSFDVEIISKSKRITTTSASTAGGGIENDHHHEMITPSNMTLAWHEGGRRRSYLPSSSSSLNLLNMKFSLGKDFESEVSIRMPTTNKSSMLNNSSANLGSASILLPGSGGKPLLSSSNRTHHHNHYNSYQHRGLSSSSHSQSQHNIPHTLQSPGTSASTTATTLQMVSDPVTTAPAPTTELQSLWKDVRTKLDVQVDEISAIAIPGEESHSAGLHIRGSGILPVDPAPSSGSSVVKMKRHEEKIKRSLQRLKKILDD